MPGPSARSTAKPADRRLSNHYVGTQGVIYLGVRVITNWPFPCLILKAGIDLAEAFKTFVTVNELRLVVIVSSAQAQVRRLASYR